MKRYDKYKDSGVKWIGEIPEHWETCFLKRLSDVTLGKMLQSVAKTSTDTLEPYFCAKDVHFDSLNKEDIKEMYFSKEEKAELEVRVGDLLVVEGGAGAGGAVAVEETLTKPHYIQNSILRVRSKNCLNTKYFYYFLFDIVKRGYIDYVCNKATIPHFTKEKLGTVYTPLPPLSEQSAIVAYLDEKTEKIDRLVAGLQEEIDRLAELKQVEIAEAVTHGLNHEVKTKDSGIKWIGRIPEHWSVRRIKFIFRETDEKNTDLSKELLSFSRTKGIVPFNSINDKEASATDLRKYKVIYPDELLENRMQAWSGMFARSGIEGCVSPDYSVFHKTKENDEVEYFASLFRTAKYVQQFANASRGIGDGFNRLYTPQFGNIYAIYPPIAEQRAIVEHIGRKTEKIDRLVAALEEQIVQLKELKQRIISDAVTGKCKVVEID